jgi:hypothetical protein
MNVYAIVLFLHVLGAIGLFVGLALEGFVLARLRASGTTGDARFFVGAWHRLKRVYIPSFAGVFLGGLYLASIVGNRATMWLAVSLGGFLLIMAVGGLITGRRMGALRKLVAADTPPAAFQTVAAATQAKALLVGYGVRLGLATGIVFLMTTKPDLAVSLAALAVAAVAGVALALKPRAAASQIPVGGVPCK